MKRLKFRLFITGLLSKIRLIQILIPKKIKYLILYNVNPIHLKDDFIIASYGELNKENTFLVIGGHNGGLYSIIHNVIGYLIFAKRKGYIPVIDYKNNITTYHSNSYNGNLWEEYFEQTSNYSLEEVYQSKRVIHTTLSFSHKYYPSSGLHILFDKKKTLNINEIFNEFIHYNIGTSKYIDEVYSKIQEKNLLGLYLRGTDYKLAKKHPRQPRIEKIFDEIDYFLSKYKEIKGIFVSTEEQETLSMIVARYGDIVYFQNRPRIKEFKEGQIVTNIAFDGVTDKIKTGREYITDIEILSRLNFFLCGLSNGSAAVIEKNGLKFIEYQVMFEGFND